MPDGSARTTTGVLGLDSSLSGGYPKGKIMLEGPASDERNALALSFAAEGLNNDEHVMIVTSTISPTKVRIVLRKLGVDVKVYERDGKLVIVDWHSHNTSTVTEIEEIGAVIKCPEDTLSLNEAFKKAFSKFPKDSRHRAVVDGLSSVIGKHNLDTALLLANSMNSSFGNEHSTVLFVVDSEMHDSSTISAIEKGFNGRIKLKRIKGEGAVIGEISIHSMGDTEVSSENLMLEQAEDGSLQIEGSGAYAEDSPSEREVSELMDPLPEDSSNENTWFRLGIHHASQMDYEKAHECFDAALKIRPGYVAAWISKANLHIEQGQNDEALHCYRQALSTGSDGMSSVAGLEETEETVEERGGTECPECGGEVSLADPFCLSCGSDIPKAPPKSGNQSIENALAICEEKIESNPDDVDAWFVKGLCLARLERLDEAIVALNEATRINFEYPGLWIVKGKVYSRIGNEKMASLSIQRGIEFARKDTDKILPTFDCSICGESVNVNARQCSNCGARFKSLDVEAEVVAAEEEEEEEVRSIQTSSELESILSKWESELTELIAPKEEPKTIDVEKREVRQKVGLTHGLVKEEREAKLSRRAGLEKGRGRINGLINGVRGRTNGLTNGVRGRTNGLTNGIKGRINGLTNGVRGRTNGLTNGLTNGVRGRTNGLTNGVRGRTNGLTNGLTNGVRGRTN
ncbi:MAG: tetratricopeptide repeat protein, partial [Thermoplasmata archaeon]|nr:tetratricopeptide repeat protein [Thermoplasmata archaeon]